MRKSRGRWGNLTASERRDVRRLVAKLDLPTLGRNLAPVARRIRPGSADRRVDSAAEMSSLQDRTRFEPAEVEPRIVERWLRLAGCFHPEPDGTPAENYSIAIPPPNVTGALHMGHALNGSIQDALIRYHRMRGQRTKWILGTDHAGIATQTQVEKQLRREGTSREEIGREAFVERVWEWREQYGGDDHRAVQAPRRLAATTTTSASRSTRATSSAVLKVFVDLYEKGLIYRDNYMVNWDPGSALGDLRPRGRGPRGHRHALPRSPTRCRGRRRDRRRHRAPRDDARRHRRRRAPRRRALPRTSSAQTAILPLVGRELPIIADDYVKPDFGTGALKITPGHDPNDFEIGRRHGLDGDHASSARTAA